MINHPKQLNANQASGRLPSNFRNLSKMTSLGQWGMGEYPKSVTKGDIGRSWVHANSEITTKKNMGKFKKDHVLLTNSCIFLGRG